MGNQHTNHNLSRIGKKYKMLTVLELLNYAENGKILAKCQCECGNICVKKLNNVVHSKTTYSCGCYRDKVNEQRYDKQKTNFNQLFASYQLSAKERNLTFELTQEDFSNIVFSNCYYCNKTPEENGNKKINRFRPEFYLKYHGVDRKDNEIGYVLENCVPACKTCNFMKKNYSYDKFLSIIKSIYENLKLNQN